jgi:hypothetical protein
VPGKLLKKPGNDTKRHTGRDEVEIRYPLNYCFFLDSPPQADFAPSGMTDQLPACPELVAGLSAACCLLPTVQSAERFALTVYL